jgi:hypothetical protein
LRLPEIARHTAAGMSMIQKYSEKNETHPDIMKKLTAAAVHVLCVRPRTRMGLSGAGAVSVLASMTTRRGCFIRMGG